MDVARLVVCRSSNPQNTARIVEDASASPQEQHEFYHLENATLPKTPENPYKVPFSANGN